MGKLLGGILWSFSFVVFAVWVFLSTDGGERMTRACMPISWVGNVTTSLTSIAIPAWEEKSETAFKKATYSCEFTLWRLFYEKDYLKELEAQKQKKSPLYDGEEDQ